MECRYIANWMKESGVEYAYSGLKTDHTIKLLDLSMRDVYVKHMQGAAYHLCMGILKHDTTRLYPPTLSCINDSLAFQDTESIIHLTAEFRLA